MLKPEPEFEETVTENTMETSSIFLYEIGAGSARQPYDFNLPRIDVADLLARAILAVLVLVIALMASMWAANIPEFARYFGVLMWAAGFVFFALALEPGIKHIWPYIATGFALPTLALLGNQASPGFLALAGATLGVWLAVAAALRK